MDFAPDNGVGWRQAVREELNDLGVIWLDPTRKPTNEAIEDIENRQARAHEKQTGHFDVVSTMMSPIRKVDLRLVDIADFVLVHLDLDIYSVGTYNELFEADRQNKPIIIHMEQGKQRLPDWLFATVPHQMVFSTWPEVYTYLRHVAQDPAAETFKRWKFFDYGMLYGLTQIPLSRGQVASISPEDFSYLNRWRWCAVSQGKSKWRAMRKTASGTTRFMHQDIAERLGWHNVHGVVVDHINGDPLDNRRDNIRLATVSQNLHNRGPQSNSRTGVKGVSYNKQVRKYSAEIHVNGKKHWLGHFRSLENARAAVAKAGTELVGPHYKESE
jgi:hypothetical protein